MRKMIKGDMLVFGDYTSYEAVNLGNMKKRQLFVNVKPPNTSSLPSAKLSADGTKAYLPSAVDPYFVILDTATGQYLPGPDVLPENTCNCVDFSPDGSEMALGFNNRDNAMLGLNLYDTTTMTLKAMPFTDILYQEVVRIAYSPDGKWLAVSGYNSDYSIYFSVYDRTTFAKVSLPTNFSTINAFEFSPNSSQLWVCGNSTSNYKLVMFRTTDWMNPYFPNVGSLTFNYLKFSPSGNRLGLVTSNTTTNAIGYFSLTSYIFTWAPVDISAYSYGGGTMLHWLDENTTMFLATPSYNYFQCLFIYNWLTSLLEINYVTMSGFVVMPGTITKKLVGTVKDATTSPVSRTIRVYDRATGEQIAEAPSTSGNFNIRVYSPDEVIVMSVGQGNEMTEMFDKVVPVAYP